MKRLIYICSMLTFLSFHLNGQDLKADLKKTQSFFVSEEKYCFETEIWEQDSKDAEVKLVNKTVVKKMNNLYRYEMADIISIIYPNQFLAVNETTKEMIYQQINIAQPDLGLKLEGLHKQLKDVQYEGVIQGQKKYRVKILSLEFDVAELYFDEDTDIFQSIKYFYVDPLADEPVYLEQRLKQIAVIPKDSDFNMQKYISASTDGITVNEKYNDYTIVY